MSDAKEKVEAKGMQYAHRILEKNDKPREFLLMLCPFLSNMVAKNNLGTLSNDEVCAAIGH